MKKIALPGAVALGLSLAGSVSADTLLYSNDFDGNEFVAPGLGVSALTNGGLEATATYENWSGNYFANRTIGDSNVIGNPAAPSELTLTNLAPHSQVTVSFFLGFLESWDSRDGGCCSPDILDFLVDGQVVASFTANNALGTIEDFGGGRIVAHYEQVNANTFYTDTIVDMDGIPALTFSHSGSSLTLALRAGGVGWQGDTDEAWGIDALSVRYDGAAPVPEPSTWAMMILGAGALAGAVRRRRT